MLTDCLLRESAECMTIFVIFALCADLLYLDILGTKKMKLGIAPQTYIFCCFASTKNEISVVSRSGKNDSFCTLSCTVQSFSFAGGGGGTCICRDTGMCHYFGYFLGCSRIFGYLFGLFPDFWVSF